MDADAGEVDRPGAEAHVDCERPPDVADDAAWFWLIDPDEREFGFLGVSPRLRQKAPLYDSGLESCALKCRRDDPTLHHLEMLWPDEHAGRVVRDVDLVE